MSNKIVKVITEEDLGNSLYVDNNKVLVNVDGESVKVNDEGALYVDNENILKERTIKIFNSDGTISIVGGTQNLSSNREWSVSLDPTLLSNLNEAYAAIHDSVTLGTVNGLSINEQILSLNLASTLEAGAMSSDDKVKLNNLENYVHTTYSTASNTFSGATVLNTLAYINGHITSLGTRTLFLSDLGYTGDSNANNYALPIAAAGVLGGIKVGAGLAIDGNGVLTATYSYSIDEDLTAIGDLTGSTGLLRKTGEDTWDIDTSTYVETSVLTSYYTKTEINDFYSGATAITGYNKTNWDTAFGWGNHTSLYSLLAHNHNGVYEPVFTKNTAFNKNFGASAGTVSEGNHLHTGVYQSIGTYDNYVSWNLKTNGVQRIATVKDGTLDIVGGTNVTATYGGGGIVTLSSTDTNTQLTQAQVGTFATNEGFIKTYIDTWTALTGTVSGYVTAQGTSNTAVFLNGNGDWSTPINTDTNTQNVFISSWVDNGTNALLRLIKSGASDGIQDITIAAGTGISVTPINTTLTLVNTAPNIVQTTITGNAGSATVFQTPRTIAGVSFNGSANISLNNNTITNGAGYITSYVNTTYTAGTGLSLTGTEFSNTITNNNQLANGAGYITSYTDTNTNNYVTGGSLSTTTLSLTRAGLTDVTVDLSSLDTRYSQSGINYWTKSGNDLSYILGKVGIGIENPINNLNVVGISQFSPTTADAGVEIQGEFISGNNSQRIFFKETEANDLYGFSLVYAGNTNPTFNGQFFITPTNTFNILRHDNSNAGVAAVTIERMTGDIGIGTDSPDTKLEVSDSSQVSIRATRTSNTYVDLYAGSSSYGSGLLSTNKLLFSTSNSPTAPDIVIDTSGKVGIGTTSPTAKLYIRGDNEATNLLTSAINSALFIAPYSASTWGLAFGSVTGQIQYIQGVSAAGGSARNLSLQPYGGNVGIGTDSPGGKLDVQGGTIEFDPGTGADATRAFNFNIGGSNYGKILLPSGSGGAMAFWTGGAGAAAERVRISITGDVGIGTDNPASKLHVAGDILTSSKYYWRGAITNTNSSPDYGIGLSNVLEPVGGTQYYTRISDYYGLLLAAGSADVLAVTRGGKVGIGTPSPNGLLELYGTGSPTGTFRVITSGGGGFTIGAKDNTASPVWRLGTNSSEDLAFEVGGGVGNGLYLKSNGNVGIGTTEPGAKLEINQDGNDEALIATGGSGGLDIARFVRDIGGNTTVGITGSGGDAQMYFTTTANTFALGTDSSSFKISENAAIGTNDRFTILSGGNVGIGKSPAAKLDVNGSIAVPFQANYFIGSSAGNGLLMDGSGNYGMSVNSSLGLGLIFESDGGTAKDFFIGTGSTDPDSATKLLTVLQGGDVGIGITPSYKLDVNGDINTLLYYKIAGVNALRKWSNYHILTNPEGSSSIYLGNTADPSNYYDNDAHYFRTRSTVNRFIITLNSATLYSSDAEYPTALLIGESTHATSRRAVVRIGEWQLISDVNANASRNFAMYSDGRFPLFIERSTAYVGINSTGPQSALQVGGTTGSNFITLGGGSTGSSYGVNWAFQNAGTNIYAQNIFDWDTRTTRGLQTNSSYPISFNVISNTGVFSSNIMTMLTEGKVGIGTDNPDSKVEISGTGEQALKITNTTNNVEIVLRSLNTTDEGWVGTLTTHPFRIASNNNTAIYVDTSQKVGIGTTNPVSKFVASNGNAEGYEIDPVVVDQQVYLTSYDRTASNYIKAFSRASSYAFGIGSTEKVTIDSSGNVGIGITPAEKLHVAGTIRQSAVTNSFVYADGTGRLVAMGLGSYVPTNRSISIQVNGGTAVTYDLSDNRTFNITGVSSSKWEDSGDNIYRNSIVSVNMTPHLTSGHDAVKIQAEGYIGSYSVDKASYGLLKTNMIQFHSSATGTTDTIGEIETSTIGIASYLRDIKLKNITNSLRVIGINSLGVTYAGADSNFGVADNGYYFRVDSGTDTGDGLYVRGGIYSTDDIEALSDRRFKENIVTIENPLSLINKISGYTYNRKGDSTRKRGGHVAQEIQSIFPFAVSTSASGELALQDRPILGLHTEAIKALSKNQNSIKKEVQILKDRIKQLESKL